MQNLKLLVLFFLTLKGILVFAAEGEEKCFIIENLEIRGAYQLSNMQINKFKKQYKNKCLTVNDIKTLTRVITNLYIDEGYITSRVYIPEQNLTEKKLIIQVQEGTIEDIEYTDGTSLKRSGLPIKKNQILNLRDIEQGIDHFNMLKSNNANIYLKPGDKPGSSIVVIDNKPSKKWHLSTGIDNNGTKTKGTNQSFTNFSFENLFGLNEYYGLGYRTGLADHNKSFMNSYSANVLIPYGYNNFTLQYNKAFYRNFIKTPRNNYSNKGGSEVTKLNIDRLIHRDGSSKTNLIAGVGHDDYSNYIANNKIEMSTYRIHKFDVGLRHARLLQASSISFSLQYTGGENQNYVTNFAKIKTPAKRFHKLNYGVSWHKPLAVKIWDKNLRYHLQVLGQYSPEMLVATEKDTVGGLQSVRGFKDYIENADTTIVARSELSAHLPAFKSARTQSLFGDISIFTAFDLGRFSNYEEGRRRVGIMSGVAAGVKNTSGYINLSCTIAKPLETPAKGKNSSVVYFSLSIDV